MTHARRHRSPPADPPRPFVVRIECGDRAGTWGAYQTLEAAAEIASRLRRHGLAATIVEAGDVDAVEVAR